MVADPLDRASARPYPLTRRLRGLPSLLRFFRWRSVAMMWDARLPRIKRLGGKWGGQEIGVELDEGLEALESRVDELALARAADGETIEEIIRYLIEKEAQRDFYSPGTLPGDAGGAGGAKADR